MLQQRITDKPASLSQSFRLPKACNAVRKPFCSLALDPKEQTAFRSREVGLNGEVRP